MRPVRCDESLERIESKWSPDEVDDASADHRSPIVVSDDPLVTIGIPTYQRAAQLARALDSALQQTHREIEVVISDNASLDGTESVCRAAAIRDDRVRYLRQQCNQGPTANFNLLFGQVRGEYVMMLADDDWLDPGYVAACLNVLRSEPDVALVAGSSRYVRGPTVVNDGVVHDHRERDPGARVRAYLRAVDDNGVFYGLMSRGILERTEPLPNVLGNDWLHVARIAWQGQIRTLEDVHVYRELGGTSDNVDSILETFGNAGWQARVPQLVIAWQLLRDIGWAHPAYRSSGYARRLFLALAAAGASMRWRDLAWHLVTPTIANLGRRKRGRRVPELYDRFTHRLGAGRRP
jgi:glycosyltransferase involved in cell wall biosynthesis